MNFSGTLWKCQTSFDSEEPLPEITYVLQFIKNELAFAKQLDKTIHAIEKSYSSFSREFVDSAPKINSINARTQEANELRNMLNNWQMQANIFENFAVKLTNLRNEAVTTYLDNMNMQCMQYLSTLNGYREKVIKAMDPLKSSIKSYDKHFAKLESALLQQKANTPQARQQKAVAFTSLNTKLEHMQSYYINFHRCFVEFAAARNSIFAEIDFFMDDMSKKYINLIQTIKEIDGGLFSKAFTEYIPYTKPRPPSFEIEREYEDKNSESGKMNVKLIQEYKTPSGVSLTTVETFRLNDARGDFWVIENSTGVHTVPCELITPV